MENEIKETDFREAFSVRIATNVVQDTMSVHCCAFALAITQSLEIKYV